MRTMLDSVYVPGETLAVQTRREDLYQVLGPSLQWSLVQALAQAGQPVTPAFATWRLLDAGCGHGALLGDLRRAFPQARLYGVDVDAQALARAQAIDPGRASLELTVHDLQDPLPATLADGAPFAVIVASLVMSHLSAPGAAVGHLATRLVPGGILVLRDLLPIIQAPHPDIQPLLDVFASLMVSSDFAFRHTSALTGAGLVPVASYSHVFPIGGAKLQGQQLLRVLRAILESLRPLILRRRLLSPADYRAGMVAFTALCPADVGSFTVFDTLAARPGAVS